MRLHVHRWGDGPRVVLVHGGVLGGAYAWRAQRPLADRWALLAVDRLGYGGSPPGREDFEVDARLVRPLLDRPAHVVGFSYGGIVAALAAAAAPEKVLSLTLVEPPADSVARGDPVVDDWARRLTDLFGARDLAPRTFLSRFFRLVGVPLELPADLPEPLERGARQLMGGRPPTEAELPLDVLRAAGFPKLVVSSGATEAFERICDAIAHGADAERDVIPGAGHLVPDTGDPFNRRLERLWSTRPAPSSRSREGGRAGAERSASAPTDEFQGQGWSIPPTRPNQEEP